jgi:hypothetical protein
LPLPPPPPTTTTTAPQADADFRACTSHVKNAAVQAYLQLEVDKFCGKLCDEVLSGAKPSNYQKRASDFKILVHREWHLAFIVSPVAAQCPTGTSQRDFNIYLIRLYANVFNEWNNRVIHMFQTPMEEHVDDMRIDEILLGSKPMVFYCAGWMLRKVESSKQRDVDKQTLKDLVAYNQQSADAAAAVNALTSKVDYCKTKTGCLKRATNSWFEFIKLLEAIYIINTNAGQALQHKGALCAKIAKAAHQSLTLREKFKQCFPPHFGDKEKKSMFCIYSILILPSYGKMKSGDTL